MTAPAFGPASCHLGQWKTSLLPIAIYVETIAGPALSVPRRPHPTREAEMAENGNNGKNGTRTSGPRCIALVGPFQSGKTTLLEAILVRTGAIQRQGTVEAGTTVGDSSKEARHHAMSVELS